VVVSPYITLTETIDKEFIDASTGSKSRTFNIEKGDGRIFLKNGKSPDEALEAE
jgi:hypothetical protein